MPSGLLNEFATMYENQGLCSFWRRVLDAVNEVGKYDLSLDQS